MKIAFDIEQMRPGCVLLQAALGAEYGMANYFPVESWLLFPTEGLKVYEVTKPQLDKLVEMVNAKMGSAL